MLKLKYFGPPFVPKSKMKSLERFSCLLVFLVQLNFSLGKKHAKVSGHESGLVCPEAEAIAPCVCYFKSKTMREPSIECKGDFDYKIVITQNTLDNLFKQLRAVNHLALNETLQLHYIRIYRAFNLTQIDLTPFMDLKIDKLQFETYYVTKLLGPNLPSGTIQVTKLVLYFNLLSDEGFGDALKYFDPNSVIDLRFTHCLFRGGHYPLNDGSGDVEFLPGLSKFTNLETLYVAGVRRVESLDVSGGQFKRNVRLQELDMHGNAKLIIGQNAFSFGQSPPELVNIPIKYGATYCDLITHADDPKSGGITGKEPPPTPTFSRPVELDYSQSWSVDFLKEELYKRFLLGHPNNTIILKRVWNFICDERMKWLKDHRELYEHRVLSSACTNDPQRKSIFETDLI